MKFLNFDRIEKDFYNWVVINRRRIFLFAVMYLVIAIVGSLPYFNLYFTREISIVLLLVLAIFIFNVSTTLLFAVGTALFVPTLLLLLLGDLEAAEFLGDYIYVILFVGVVQEIINFKNKSAQ